MRRRGRTRRQRRAARRRPGPTRPRRARCGRGRCGWRGTGAGGWAGGPGHEGRLLHGPGRVRAARSSLPAASQAGRRPAARLRRPRALPPQRPLPLPVPVPSRPAPPSPANPPPPCQVYERAFRSLREGQPDAKEEAVMLLEAWREFERGCRAFRWGWGRGARRRRGGKGLAGADAGPAMGSYHTIPYHTIPYHTDTIPYHTDTIPYHTIPYHTIPYHTIPYHTIPYHAIP
jgi:hypothetical protein